MSTVGSVLISFGAGSASYFAASKAVKDDASGFPSLFGGVGGAIAGVFAGIGAAISAGAIVASLKSAGEQVTELAHDADRLSVSTEQLSRLRFAAKDAGVDSEELSKAMLKAQVSIGKAAVEGGEAADTLKKLGINIDALKNQAPGKQFTAIADAIASIKNPSERAAAEVSVFGKSGAQLKPLLEEGAAGIAAMSAEADKLGVTVSSVDAESTLRASQAVDKVSEAVSGVGEHIAAGLAPYIEDVANKMITWATTGQHVQSIISIGLSAVAVGTSFVADTWSVLKGTVEIAGGVIGGAIGVVLEVTAAWGDAVAYILNHVFGTKIDTSSFDNAANDILKSSGKLINSGAADIGKVFTGENRDKVFNYFQDIQNHAQKTSTTAVAAHKQIAGAFDVPEEASENVKKITSTLADLHKQVDEFGMSEGLKKLHELKTEGANKQQQAEGADLERQLELLKSSGDAQKQLADLQKQAAEVGMSESNKALSKFQDLEDKKVDALKAELAAGQISHLAFEAKIADVNKELDAAYAAQTAIESANKAKEESKKLDEEEKQAIEKSLTPIQKEQEEIAKLQKLYDTGRLSKEQFAAAKAKAEKELHGESHDTQDGVTRGSEAAFKMMDQINQRIHGGGSKDELQKRQTAAAEKSATLMERLIEKVGGKAKHALAHLGV